MTIQCLYKKQPNKRFDSPLHTPHTHADKPLRTSGHINLWRTALAGDLFDLLAFFLVEFDVGADEQIEDGEFFFG